METVFTHSILDQNLHIKIILLDCVYSLGLTPYNDLQKECKEAR